jgi:hypothetical protein
MGETGDSAFSAFSPAVAYNSTDNEYLVVWYGDDDFGGGLDGDFEIFGQRLDAATGAEEGTNDFRISEMGGANSADYDAFAPAISYNNADNEYLVVWQGADNTYGLDIGEHEIFGQRLEGDTGFGIAEPIRISHMGGTGDPTYTARSAAVVFNDTSNEYLVVWDGDDDSGGLLDNEFEIFGQRIDGDSGAEIGFNDFRISDMGGTGNAVFWATAPAVAFNSTNNEYLVVWKGDDGTGDLVDDEFEVFGQRINASNGAETGANDFRISDMGGTGDTGYNAGPPKVAYIGASNEYLVVWIGDDDTGGLLNDEFEVFSQRINAATGVQNGANDVRITDMGGIGNTLYRARTFSTSLHVASNPGAGEAVVVWSGDDSRGSLVVNEWEIFGQRVSPLVTTLFENDFELGSPGFSIDNDFGDGAGLWHLAVLCSAGDFGHSATTALFYGDTATCNYDAGTSEGIVTMGPINLEGVSPPAELRFNYLLETEGAADSNFDVASLEISTGGGPFELVASNAPSPGEVGLFDPSGSWETAAIDLSGQAGSSFRARFHFRTGGSLVNAFPGFYVDDLTVITTAALAPFAIFADGFESGDTCAWSANVGGGSCP